MTDEAIIMYRRLRVVQTNTNTGVHNYLSTGCYHGGNDLDSVEHRYCRIEVGNSDFKKPGMCKFCDVLCVCPCHKLYPASAELRSLQTPSTGSPE